MFVYEIVIRITNVIFAITCTIGSGSLYTGIVVLDSEHKRTVISLAWLALANMAPGSNSQTIGHSCSLRMKSGEHSKQNSIEGTILRNYRSRNRISISCTDKIFLSFIISPDRHWEPAFYTVDSGGCSGLTEA
jgi:hypothetical protein